MSTVLGWRGRPIRLLALLLSVAVCTSILVTVNARPASAHYPTAPCLAEYVGYQEYQFFTDGTEDYIVYECRRTINTPYLYYWQMTGINNLKEQAEAFKKSIIRFVRDEVWQGIVTGGFGVFQESPYDRAHVRYEGAFDLRNWQGSRIYRQMGVHLVAKHYVNGGWYSCGDTGWKNSSTTVSSFSYSFYTLNSNCGGTIKLYTAAHFLQQSTGTWWTSSWVETGPYTILPPV